MSEIKTNVIGAVIEYNNRKYMVVEDTKEYKGCNACDFAKICYNIDKNVLGACDKKVRTDHKNIHFEEVKDKEPDVSKYAILGVVGFRDPTKKEDEGDFQYIDIKMNTNNDNSVTLSIIQDSKNVYKIDKVVTENGVVKINLVRKQLTYGDIVDALGDKAIKLPGGNTPNNSVTIIDNTIRLMNVANYYNGSWQPDWNDENAPKYSIAINYKERDRRNQYFVVAHTQVNQSTVYFKNKEDAQAVIDNPYLVMILNNIFGNA